MEIDCDAESFDSDENEGWSFWGSIVLSDGETEEDAHERLRALLPDRSITTRWRWVGDDPWDEVFQDEPLKP